MTKEDYQNQLSTIKYIETILLDTTIKGQDSKEMSQALELLTQYAQNLEEALNEEETNP